MILAHEIRGRLHALRLHLTFLERALAKASENPQVVESSAMAMVELRELELRVLELIARGAPGPADA